jgi:hypothetical protein
MKGYGHVMMRKEEELDHGITVGLVISHILLILL